MKYYKTACLLWLAFILGLLVATETLEHTSLVEPFLFLDKVKIFSTFGASILLGYLAGKEK